MKLVTGTTLPMPTTASGFTDSELLNTVRHYYPNPNPILEALFERFGEFVSSEASRDCVDVSKPLVCPHCSGAVAIRLEDLL